MTRARKRRSPTWRRILRSREKFLDSRGCGALHFLDRYWSGLLCRRQPPCTPSNSEAPAHQGTALSSFYALQSAYHATVGHVSQDIYSVLTVDAGRTKNV